MMSTRNTLQRKTAEPEAQDDVGVKREHDDPVSDKTASAEIKTERRSANRPFSGAARGRQSAKAEQGRDVAGLKALLDEEFEHDRRDAVAKPAEPDARAPDVGASTPVGKGASGSGRRWLGRIVKTLIGIAVIVVVGVMPAQRLLQVSSVEAVLNAPLVTVRAPISSVVGDVAGDLRAGRQVPPKFPMVTINNSRADISRVVTYSDRLESLQYDQSSKAARLEAYRELESELQARVDTFTQNRILQLDARLEQAQARIEGAGAAFENAKAVRERASELRNKGITSLADLEAAQRDAVIAEQTVRQLRAERDELKIELAALNQGTFLGDDYNDRPQSAQRLDEVRSTIASLSADLKAGDVQIDWAKKTLNEEKRRYGVESKAQLGSPIAGSIWQVLVATGENVEAGEPLFNVLDCSKLLATAVVSEAVYNSLVKGTPAAFRFREGGDPLKGEVILLSGMATASSSLAITPAALTREAYRVTVSLDNPYASQGVCAIGRTGRVVFGRDAV